MKHSLYTAILIAVPVFFLLSIAIVPATTYADHCPGHTTDLPVYEKLVPDIPLINSECANVPEFINATFGITVAVAAVLAVIMIAIGGFKIMTSDVPFEIVSGKGYIQDALLGLTLVLASVLILSTINPRIVRLDIFCALREGGVCEGTTTAPPAGSGAPSQQAPGTPGTTYTVNASCTANDTNTCTVLTFGNATFAGCTMNPGPAAGPFTAQCRYSIINTP